jgi:3-hydroxyisobutyrate dehydrogenase-like beta-hydroxyacid dehydrogenase
MKNSEDNFMSQQHIGFLHPGNMGISIAASAQNSGHLAYWVSDRRGEDTVRRASKYTLLETESIQQLAEKCAIIISVCPPHAASEVAKQVLSTSFKGIFVDANAISPQRTKEIGVMMHDANVDFVDGGIIGGPAWDANETWLYLSGRKASLVADCFANGPLETEIIGEEIGKASALKMVFAAYSKGHTALLSAIVAASENLGVRKELENQWTRYDESMVESTHNRMQRVTAKAWRFAGEMEEIAETLASVDIPDGFHRASYEVYKRLEDLKDSDPLPSIEEVLVKLARKNDQ